MKNKNIFVENLIDATKHGSVVWHIDKNSNLSGNKRCETKIDTTTLWVDVRYNPKTLNPDFSNIFSKVFVIDRTNIDGGNLSITVRDCPLVEELEKVLYDKVVLPFLKTDLRDEKNDKFIGELSDKIGKYFFRERRLGSLLDEDKDE